MAEALSLEDAMRYLGAPPEDGVSRALVAEMADLLTRAVTPRSVWRMFPLQFQDGPVALGETGVTLPGALAARMLGECAQAAVMVCTLGTAFDRLLAGWQARDIARAAALDACGSAYVEAACDRTEMEIVARFPDAFLTDRFSPGYGDLPLATQDGLLALLDAARAAGVCCNAAHLMMPVKSVTAVIGLAGRPQPARIRGCGHCALAGRCLYRERGTHCEA